MAFQQEQVTAATCTHWPHAVFRLTCSCAHADHPTLVPLALTFLPLSATDAACRQAIITHRTGVPVLLREAGEKNNKGAIAALNRVAGDKALKAACASIIAQVRLGYG